MAEQQLAATVDQLLLAYGVQDAPVWGPIITHLAEEATSMLSPAKAVLFGNLDPRFYIKVPRPPVHMLLQEVPEAHVYNISAAWCTSAQF